MEIDHLSRTSHVSTVSYLSCSVVSTRNSYVVRRMCVAHLGGIHCDIVKWILLIILWMINVELSSRKDAIPILWQ